MLEADWAEKDEEKDPEKEEKTSLSDIPDKVQTRLQRKWFAGRRYMYMSAVYVDPEYQGRGVGSAIMEWGEERADREGVVAFLQSSAPARGFYERREWNRIDFVELDLSQWANEKEQGGGLGYGIYRIVYMIRVLVGKRKL